MRTLYIQCAMGAAGDMLMAALSELIPDREVFVRRMRGLSLPGVELELTRAESHGMAGTHAAVRVRGQEEDAHSHSQGEAHGHGHHHHGPHLGDVLELIRALPVSERVREDACGVYRAIAAAEAAAHGKDVELVHFHEVGALDAIADVVGVSLLMEEIAPERVVVSPVRTGYGTVNCAHGVLPVPAPATAALLKGVPVYAGDIEGEMCTPTGAALIGHFADSFGNMPLMTVEAIGTGLGTRDFGRANCLRVFLGEAERELKSISELRCNIDDATPEELGFAMELLLERGALDVFTVPIGMKKSRPAVMLCCLCEAEREEEMGRLLLRHTPTLGVRIYRPRRMTLERRVETRETRFGPARLKVARGWGVEKAKVEYDDASRAARESGTSFAEASAIIMADAADEKGQKTF